VWFLYVHASQKLHTNSFVVLYQQPSYELTIFEYKTRICLYIIWKMRVALQSHKFQHVLYRHFPENWRLKGVVFSIGSLFFNQVQYSVKICLLAILWSVSCILPLSHPLGWLRGLWDSLSLLIVICTTLNWWICSEVYALLFIALLNAIEINR
jgi:hypothetical protein